MNAIAILKNIESQVIGSMRITDITDSIGAVRYILNAFRHYNKLMMIGKLRAYIAALRESDRAAAEFLRLTTGKAETENSVILNNGTIERLRREDNECAQIVNSLSEKHNNEASAAKKLTQLRFEAENNDNAIKKNDEDILAKKTRINQTGTSIRTLETEAQWRAGRIGGIMQNLSSLADEAAFEEHEFMAEVFKEKDEFNYIPIKEAIKIHDKKLREGLAILEKLDRLHTVRDELNTEIKNREEALQRKNIEFAEAEASLAHVKSVLINALNDWSAENMRLTVLPDIMEDIKNAVNNYRHTDERPRLSLYIDELSAALRGAIDRKIGAKRFQINGLNEEKGERQAEIRRLRDMSRLGALTGETASGHTAGHIYGAGSGDNSMAAIQALQVKIEGLIKQIGAYEAEIEALKSEAAKLQDECKHMPDTDNLAEAAGILRNLEMEIQTAGNEYKNLTGRMTPVNNEILELSIKMTGLQEQISLPPEINAYWAALDSISKYAFTLTDLIDEHNNLLASIARAAYETDHMDGLKTDLENLQHCAAGLARWQKYAAGEIDGIEEWLRASGYEEAVRIIGARQYRMEEIRNSLDILLKASDALDAKLTCLDEDIEAARHIKTAREHELAIVRQALEDEAALGYTDITDLDTNDRVSVNKALNRLELSKRDFTGKSAEDMEKEVHSRLFDNIQYLSAYDPQEVELFEQPPEISLKIKRVDIVCMAEGQKTGIADLYIRLENEAIRRGLIETSDQKQSEGIYTEIDNENRR